MLAGRIPTIAESTISWLEKHPAVNVLLVLGHVVFILLGHDPFVRVSIMVMNGLSLPVYNTVVAIIGFATAIGFVAMLIPALRKLHPERPKKLLYLNIILLMLLLHCLFLLEMNIELIHTALYAGLAFLLLPFTRRPGAVLVSALPIMLLDEWYQYQVLYPDYVEYFETNDVLLDVLGITFLLCALWIMGIRLKASPYGLIMRPEVVFLACLVGLCLLAVVSCLVVQFPQDTCDNTWMILNTLTDPKAFWQVHPFTGRTYHVLTPIESLLVIPTVMLLFMGMGEEKKG